MSEHAAAAKAPSPHARPKTFRGGTERAALPQTTVERARSLMQRLGVSRVANITGLDCLKIPVVAVYRPNSRSLSVSLGKGATLVEAQASGLMESIEGFHAEHLTAPLLLGSHRELVGRYPIVDVKGLPRLSTSDFHQDSSLLWVTGIDLSNGGRTLVPYELVHMDFRIPLPTGSGAFFMSSNGLASGNDLLEATSHAICELVERDGVTLWQLAGGAARSDLRVDLSTVTDGLCRDILDRFEAAGVVVAVWETTSDIGIPTFFASIVDRDRHNAPSLPPVSGSGCHPRRRIALLRALTEAAQGRLTVISGSRDDLSARSFEAAQSTANGDRLRALIGNTAGRRSFCAAPDVAHDTFDQDVQWELAQLDRAGLHQVVTVNLTKPELAIPVVRVIIPYLEAMVEVPGYVPGSRARRRVAELQA